MCNVAKSTNGMEPMKIGNRNAMMVEGAKRECRPTIEALRYRKSDRMGFFRVS